MNRISVGRDRQAETFVAQNQKVFHDTGARFRVACGCEPCFIFGLKCQKLIIDRTLSTLPREIAVVADFKVHLSQGVGLISPVPMR